MEFVPVVTDENVKLTLSGTIIFNGEPVEIALDAEYASVDESVVKISGRFDTSIDTVCDVCAKEIKLPIVAKFEETFTGKTGEEDGYEFDGETVVLDEMIEHNIVFALPQKIVCKPDCKGLCSMCGIDLNDKSCNCKHEKTKDNPFEKLSGLFENNKEV